MMVEDEERKSIELLFWSWGHGLAKKTATIRNLLYLIRGSLASPSPDLDLISSRLDAIDRLSLEIAATPLPFQLEQISLNALVQELVEWLKSLEPYHSVVFQVDLESSQPVVAANSTWLRRILEILIENAVEAMSESEVEQIEIQTRTNGAGVTVSVKDRGKGIEGELISKLLQSPPVLRSGGKGRGLHIVRLAVELYGGKIQIDTAPTGTTVAIWLPLDKRAGQE